MSASSPLRDALDSRDFSAARALAVELPEIDLEDALELTLLAADEDPELYVEMARRWLARYVVEKAPRPSELQNAAQILARAAAGSLPPTDASTVLGTSASEKRQS